ncbi:MAG: nitroreductase family protein [Gaiellales bacterium]
METFLAITSRRDERGYRAGPLPSDVVERILDAGRLAGSARNRQPWSFVVVESPEARAPLAAAVFVPENIHAAGLVVAIAVKGSTTAHFDAGRAAQNMLLAAWNEGVASCPNALADEAAARAALGLDDGEVPAIVLSFGIPEKSRAAASRSAAEWSVRANRRPLSEVVRKV